MANKISLEQKEYGDEYEPSDSEEDYNEEEREILRNVREGRERPDDDNEEVLRFDSASDEDENDLGDNSDFDEPVDDGIPDSKAWGKRRSDYYNTDFVDQDYSTYNEKEEELARQEEEDAKEIQQRLAKQLNEADFSLDLYTVDGKEEEFEKVDANKLKTDLNDLSIRQKAQLFQKDSPEFTGLVRDFEHNMRECEIILEPIIEHAAQHGVKHIVIDFAKTLNKIAFAYCTNISFYLLLKAKRIPVKNHPIVKRLVNLKQLLESLSEKYEKVVKPQLEVLLEAFEAGVDVGAYLDKSVDRGIDIATRLDEVEAVSEDDGVAMEEANPADEIADERDDGGRRGITYQIAKNKGLTPNRKKELRNPRVKHRGKFRKALIRRKGAVRAVRRELKRYSGEISGIKATVKKGIKIKS